MDSAAVLVDVAVADTDSVLSAAEDDADSVAWTEVPLALVALEVMILSQVDWVLLADSTGALVDALSVAEAVSQGT